MASLIVPDKAAGSLQDLRCGTVIDPQRQGHKLRVQLRKLLKAFRVRTPEAVDGLIRIPDGKELLPLPVPEPDQFKLVRADVLEFIDEEIVEALSSEGFPLFLPKEPEGLSDEAVEVQDLRSSFRLGGLSRQGLRKLLLFSRVPGQHKGLPGLLQELQAEGMEGADLHPVEAVLQGRLPGQPFPELPGRLSGKGHRCDLRGLYAPFLHQIQDMGDQGLCLSRSGARDHGCRPSRKGGGCLLFFVQHRRFLLRRFFSFLRRFFRRDLLLFPPVFGAFRSLLSLRLPLHFRKGEEAQLPLSVLQLLLPEQPDLSVFSVVAGAPDHLSCPEPADPLSDPLSCHGPDLLHRQLPQDPELRPQLLQHLLIPAFRLYALGAASCRSSDHLPQGHQALKGLRSGTDKALGPVRQLLDPVEDPDRQLLPADGAAPLILLRFLRLQAEVAFSVAVVVVFSLLREKFHRSLQALSPLKGPVQPLIGQIPRDQVGLPSQLRRRMGVGV